MKITYLSLLIIVITLHSFQNTYAQENKNIRNDTSVVDEKEKLVVLWTSGDLEVAKNMVFMYTYNAKKYGWWKDITFIIWGPSSKLLAENQELQDYLKKMKEAGIKLEACKACADKYGISDKLKELGVDVKYMGTVLTDYIKSERHLITF